MESKSNGRSVKPIKQTIAQIVDEYGELQERLAPLKGLEKLSKTLADAIRAHCEKFAASESRALEGIKYLAIAGAKANERTITDMPQVFDIIGKTEFLKHCKLTLKDLDDLVPLAKRGDVTTEERTGTRTLTAVPRTAPAVAKRAA